jgi:hypothetical protein
MVELKMWRRVDECLKRDGEGRKRKKLWWGDLFMGVGGSGKGRGQINFAHGPGGKRITGVGPGWPSQINFSGRARSHDSRTWAGEIRPMGGKRAALCSCVTTVANRARLIGGSRTHGLEKRAEVGRVRYGARSCHTHLSTKAPWPWFLDRCGRLAITESGVLRVDRVRDATLMGGRMQFRPVRQAPRARCRTGR